MPCAANFCSTVPAMFRPRLISLAPDSSSDRARLFRASRPDMQAGADQPRGAKKHGKAAANPYFFVNWP
jgi:hypothetical protein